VSQQNSTTKNLEATGIGACACTAHGVFLSAADFKHGERSYDYTIPYAIKSNISSHRQAYMDNVLHRAFQLSPAVKRFIISYDINCQYSIHLLDRFKKCHPHLKVPEAELLFSIGSFHLGAHVIECFHKYGLHFLLGAGVISGEILETLWIALNKLAPSTRAMSKAHRAEILDDIMGDSNWKKVLGMGKMSN
jgi:hypothetical protein